MRKHGGTPSRRDKHVTLAAISPPGVARGRFVGGQQSGLAGSKPPPLFTREASSCSSQGRRQGEPWGASPRPSAPTYLPPAGPPRCVPVLPMGARGCCSSSVVLCSCSCLSVCRAPSRVVRCGSFGWRVCVTVLGLVARMVRVVRLVLWCRDAPSDVAGWARRNTPVPVGRGVGAAPCGELVAPRMPRVGLSRRGVPGSVAAPLPLMDAVNCLQGVCPLYLSHWLYVS